MESQDARRLHRVILQVRRAMVAHRRLAACNWGRRRSAKTTFGRPHMRGCVSATGCTMHGCCTGSVAPAQSCSLSRTGLEASG